MISVLNQIGIEVEDVLYQSNLYNSICVALITDTAQHPNASKLQICTVWDGKEKYQIVCGAHNARAGLKVALAHLGAIIPGNCLLIKESEIRGIKSFGMLCSEEELCLNTFNPDGIIELSEDAEIGTAISEHLSLKDVILDLAITPNRGDAASAIGIARDLAAAGLGELLSEMLTSESLNNLDYILDVSIEDKNSCLGMEFIKFGNINNSKWANDISCLMLLLGIKNNCALVDISNFIMISNGRPNHIYDADKITGKISIRYSKKGEKFQDLFGKEHELIDGILIISDEEKILSIAGVIGGNGAIIDQNTKNIIVEIGVFPQASIVKATRFLNINTDSSFRFARGVDHGNTLSIKNFITELIIEKCQGRPIASYSYTNEPKKKIIPFSGELLLKIAGQHIQNFSIILERLGFVFIGQSIKVPSWRYWDINIEEDLVEEILRIYGINNIHTTTLPNSCPIFNYDIEDSIRKTGTHIGLNEVVSWSFCDKKYAEYFMEDVKLLTIQNPITKDFSVMRPSMLPTMLKIISYNTSYSIKDCAIFEIGNIYSNLDSIIQERRSVAAIRTGIAERKNVFNSKERYLDFFDIKADFVSFLEEFCIYEHEINFLKDNLPSYYHPTRSAAVYFKGQLIGYCGEFHPKLLSELKLGVKHVVALEIFLDNLTFETKNGSDYNFSKSEYQPVQRDFCFIMDKSVSFQRVKLSIMEAAQKYIDEIHLVDTFESPDMGHEKHSMTVNILLRNKSKTFDEVEINEISQKIVQNMNNDVGAVLRQR